MTSHASSCRAQVIRCFEVSEQAPLSPLPTPPGASPPDRSLIVSQLFSRLSLVLSGSVLCKLICLKRSSGPVTPCSNVLPTPSRLRMQFGLLTWPRSLQEPGLLCQLPPCLSLSLTFCANDVTLLLVPQSAACSLMHLSCHSRDPSPLSLPILLPCAFLSTLVGHR